MNVKKVEFLTSVDIRKAWSKEDKDFTPWVARPDVLQELFDQCDIGLGTDFEIETEVPVPGIKRKLDILITSESGENIAIENQFSTMDHDHLTRGFFLMFRTGTLLLRVRARITPFFFEKIFAIFFRFVQEVGPFSRVRMFPTLLTVSPR